jgi:hypothetical protein
VQKNLPDNNYLEEITHGLFFIFSYIWFVKEKENLGKGLNLEAE